MANDKIASQVNAKWKVSGKTKDNQLKANVFKPLTTEEQVLIDEMHQYNSDKAVAANERSPSRKQLDERIREN